MRIFDMENRNMEQKDGYPAVLETVEKSTDEIADLRNESSEMVMNVQIANDMRELNRRDVESKSKTARIQFLEDEARKAETQLDEIDSKWDVIGKYNDAIDIHNACEIQKNKYTEVFECKNKIIETLKKELSKADEKFMNDQLLQQEDIRILSTRINNQLEIMKNAYRRHLNLIEETIERERNLLLYRKHQEWINLNESYAQQQRECLDETFNTVEEYEKSISEMVSEHHEKYRAAKKRLDEEVQTLHVELERTKSTCLLNERKLEYNYLVLSKRYEELGKIKAAQRRRINKLRDVLNEMQNKKQECEKAHKCEVVKYKKCIEDLKQNVDSVSGKINRTDDINENTYRKIWKFNEKRVEMFLKEVYDVDKFIHEKLLRNKWEAPQKYSMTITELPSVQYALRHLPNFQLSDEDHYSETKSHLKRDCLENLHLLKFILLNIADSIEFLISDRIEQLTDGLTEEKKSLVLFDNTLKVLKISNENELNLLRNQFAPHVECLTCKKREHENKEFPAAKSRYYKSLAASKRTGSGNSLNRKLRFSKLPLSARVGGATNLDNQEAKKICENPQHSWFIDQLSVIKLLTDFIRERRIRERKKHKDEPLQKVLLSRILSPKDVVLYWSQFRSNFVEERNAFWEAMIPRVSKYQGLLQENVKVEAEVQRLSLQNSELKKAFKNFTVKFPGPNEI